MIVKDHRGRELILTCEYLREPAVEKATGKPPAKRYEVSMRELRRAYLQYLSCVLITRMPTLYLPAEHFFVSFYATERSAYAPSHGTNVGRIGCSAFSKTEWDKIKRMILHTKKSTKEK